MARYKWDTFVLTHWDQDTIASILQSAFQMHILEKNIWILISLKFIPKGWINNIPALVQIMAWCWLGHKPLSEPMQWSPQLLMATVRMPILRRFGQVTHTIPIW